MHVDASIQALQSKSFPWVVPGGYDDYDAGDNNDINIKTQ